MIARHARLTTDSDRRARREEAGGGNAHPSIRGGDGDGAAALHARTTYVVFPVALYSSAKKAPPVVAVAIV